MEKINCVHFNRDKSCFIVAHSRGFNVYNTDPVDHWVSRDFGADAGIAVASVLDRTNYMVLVGNGSGFPKSRIILWNDQAQDGSKIDFGGTVLNALIGRQGIVAVLENSVHICALAPPHPELKRIDTYANPLGVAALYNSTLVVPACTRGQIAVVDIIRGQVESIVACHRSSIAAIALNDEYIATASETGTLIRLHDRRKGAERWFRRGLDKARVFSLALSPQSTKLAVLSDKQTLHVFDLGSMDRSTNEKHPLAEVPFTPKHYFRDEWSSARVKTPSKELGICGWTTESSVIVLRSRLAQWEKYTLQENGELRAESCKSIR